MGSTVGQWTGVPFYPIVEPGRVGSGCWFRWQDGNPHVIAIIVVFVVAAVWSWSPFPFGWTCGEPGTSRSGPIAFGRVCSQISLVLGHLDGMIAISQLPPATHSPLRCSQDDPLAVLSDERDCGVVHSLSVRKLVP